jgi:hypothetical protein
MARALMPLASSVVVVAAVSCSPPPFVPMSCADIDAGACYSNTECEVGERCTWSPLLTNRNLVAVTCCMAGTPGAGAAGATCKSMDDCTSGVCAYTPNGLVCSTHCTGEAGAPDPGCPTQLPWCISVDPVDAGLFAAGADGPGIDAGTFCGLGR